MMARVGLWVTGQHGLSGDATLPSLTLVKIDVGRKTGSDEASGVTGVAMSSIAMSPIAMSPEDAFPSQTVPTAGAEFESPACNILRYVLLFPA